MQTLPDPQTEASQRERRLLRWRQFAWLRDHSVRKGAKHCYMPLERKGDGWDEIGGPDVKVGITAGGIPHVEGTKRCGSVHACSHCAPMIREARATTTDQLLSAAIAAGCKVRFVTTTAQHHEGQSLAWLYTNMSESWSDAFSGAAAEPGREFVYSTVYDLASRKRKVIREEVRASWYIGQVKAFDVTHGGNGWHPHFHTAFVFDGDVPDKLIDDWLAGRGAAFRSNLADRGMWSAADSRGWDVKKVSNTNHSATAVSRYLTKIDGGWGVGLEMARSDLKKAKAGGRNPFQILCDAVAGDHHSAQLWREYEEATLGKVLIRTGRRLAARFGIDPDEASDEELAQGEVTESFVVEVVYSAREWKRLVAGGHVGHLLNHLSEAVLSSAHNLRTQYAGLAPP